MNQVFDAYAAYYDLLYADKDYAGESRFVRQLLMNHGVVSGDVLELGCGTGRHARQLAGLGYNVHGIDLSLSMVEIANTTIPSELSERLKFEVDDVRTVMLGRKFDAAISLFHVVSYQINNMDIQSMFMTVASHLNIGGVFVFDCWYGPAVLSDRPVVRVKRMRGGAVDVLRIAEPIMHPNKNVVDVNYTIQVTNRNSVSTEQFNETHRMRYMFAPEIELFLELAGMRCVEMVEWMTGREPGFETWAATFVAVRYR